MKGRRRKLVLTAVLLVWLMLPFGADAEIVGRTAGGYIHRYTTDKGQDIYFFSIEEETLVETETDVNFDGHTDLTVVTARGASNTYYEFYLWNGREYEYAERWTGDIANYALVDGKYLVSRRDDDDEGMLFYTQICIWEGGVLKTLRTMVSEEETSIAPREEIT